METSLHRTLKTHYAGADAATEVRLGRFRIDAVRDGELIEVQCGSLAAIRAKVTQLVQNHRVRVVRPIIARKRIFRIDQPGGPVLRTRMSPRRGTSLELFDELIYFRGLFPHANLTIEVPLVSVEEWRQPPDPKRKDGRRRRRRARHHVHDVSLVAIESQATFQVAEDLLGLIDARRLPVPFDTAQLAEHLQRPRWIAQRIAYVLRNCGAVAAVGQRGNSRLYEALLGSAAKPRKRKRSAGRAAA